MTQSFDVSVSGESKLQGSRLRMSNIVNQLNDEVARAKAMELMSVNSIAGQQGRGFQLTNSTVLLRTARMRSRGAHRRR